MAICKRTGSGKSWRRRLRSLINRALLLSAATVQAAAAQQAPDGSATLETFLDGVQSLTADFKSEIWNADQELEQTETGTLSLKRPNHFRWVYDAPSELTIVADGAQLWIYDVELAEVTVAPFDSVGSSPAMLLSGDRKVRDEFDVVQVLEADGLDWVKLEPKGNSDFSSVSIGFSGKEPRRLELVDGLGQVTRIAFDNVIVNPEIADDVFVLDVPEGVHVVGGEG